MKRSILLIICALFALSSCDDFLDKNPLDQMSSEVFWKNEEDIKLAVTGCYSRLKGGTLDYQRGYLDGLSDIAHIEWGLYGISDMSIGLTNQNTLDGFFYNPLYNIISQCNFVMDNMDKASSVSETIRNKYKAEVRFLRALAYFDLVNFFGDVVMYKTLPANADESKIAKSPKEDVYRFIEEDLDFAIANLPDEMYHAHAVKGSAMALKVRVLLYQQKWQATASLAKMIIDSGTFSLYDDFPNMFLNEGQTNNPEIMFSCKYLSPTSYHSGYGMNIEYSWHIFPYRTLLDAWECTDGKPISESPLYDPANKYDNRDPRLDYSIRKEGTNWEGFYDTDTYNFTGVFNRKYVDPTIPADYAHAFLQDWDYILIRYADVLLMYAEALNELSGPDNNVYSAIDAVRGRKGVEMPPVDRTRYNTKELVRDFIVHERMVEFPMEGLRYFDLKRWRIAHILLPKYTNPAGIPLVFEQKHYYLPFRQSELTNNPQLVQNDGYN